MDKHATTVLGIDMGSVSVGLVHLTTDRKVLRTAYAIHGGDIAGTLRRLLPEFDLAAPLWVAAGDATPLFLRTTARYNDQICCISAARFCARSAG